MNPIETFLERCETVGRRLHWKRSTLSTKLFNDGKRLDELVSGVGDIGVRRLARAQADLDHLAEQTVEAG